MLPKIRAVNEEFTLKDGVWNLVNEQTKERYAPGVACSPPWCCATDYG